MIEQEIDLNKLAEALGKSLTNNMGFLAEELADVVLIKAPVETGRMVRSINVNDGNNPKLTDTYRSNKVEKNVQGVKASQKLKIRTAVNRRIRRRGSNRQNETWWLTSAAPYSGNVHSGQAYRNRIKGMPRRQQRAAFANMRDKMEQRGQTQYERKTGQGHNFFSIKSNELAKAARKAARRNRLNKVNI
ncbi:hypothetical protein BCV44_13375 [Vibrio cyclitrophicus]|uniref:hypothetical protein n=1 Tax=Vibrio cyclitrophicus TaxID=47951 RepID=UPI000C846794|nr:hypothetical protein [Vibrio cyclitrophicus]PME16788.1 hypothetical protein BCV44_13375 [Vibrio cyclitrophicus]